MVKKAILFVLSFAAWSLLFGWQMTTILMAGIWFHGLGHIIAAKSINIETFGIYFIPFLGAAEPLGKMPADQYQQAILGLAGPTFGIISVLILIILEGLTNNTTFALGASVLALLNLLNLLPISPLDGGRSYFSVITSLKLPIFFLYIGLLLSLSLILLTRSYVFMVLLFLFGRWQINMEKTTRLKEENEEIPMRPRMPLYKTLFIISAHLTLFLTLLILLGATSSALLTWYY